MEMKNFFFVFFVLYNIVIDNWQLERVKMKKWRKMSDTQGNDLLGPLCGEDLAGLETQKSAKET